MDRVRRIFEGVSTFGNVIASVFLAFVMWIMIADIIGRYVFNHPVPGTFEMVTVSMGVLTTIGFAFALERNIHIRATIVAERVPPVARHYMLLYAFFVGFIVTGVFVWELVISAGKSVAIAEHTAGILHIPIYPVKIILIFSVLLFCVAYGLRFAEGIRRLRQ